VWKGKWHQQEHRLAYIPAFLWYFAEGERRGCQKVQELLRHANSRITLDVYTQTVNSTKRAAQSKVVKMMVPGVGKTGVETYPQIAQ
jgi:integrase